MDCKQIRELLPEYLFGDLNAKTGKKVKEHISLCPECRHKMENIDQVWSKLEQIPSEELDQGCRERFFSMLEIYRSGMNNTASSVSFPERTQGLLEKWWPRHPVFQMGLALVFLLFGLAAGQMVQRRGGASDEIAQLKKEVQETRQLVSLALLIQPSAGERLRGVEMISSVKDPDDRFLFELLKTLNYDPNVNVRLAAVDAFSAFTDRALVRTELVTSLSSQTSPLVQISLINLLVSIREKKAVEVFQSLIDDKNCIEPVKKRARLGIETII